jgi:hypothetical protein
MNVLISTLFFSPLYFFQRSCDKTLFHFYAHPQENILIGELFCYHSNIVNGQLPLEQYLNINHNNKDIVGLLKQGEGLFSRGPVNLIKVHDKVLSGHGYKTSIIELSSK